MPAPHQTSSARPAAPVTSTSPAPVRRGLLLVVVLVAALAINIDTTVVNVALPALTTQLGSSTSGLQWVVDGYNLAFAALVLAGGNIGDRYGRRGTLAVGLALFAVASLGAALVTTTAALITMRIFMGAAAALIYPTTLSVISNAFPERNKRAAAIGAWGAVSGLGVAVGPVLGGGLLEKFWWGSIFLSLIPVALLAMVGALLVVPPSRDRARPALDRLGLVLSIMALGALTYTIIEAPAHGWLSAFTLAGFLVAAVSLAVFIRVEARHPAPLLDVRLFTNLRFSAASGAVTVAFFSLFGFIFLITQYLQLLKAYAPLETGLRILPVAVSIAVGSVLGARLAVVTFGTKAVVATGLLLLGSAFAWVSTASTSTSYLEISTQMVMMGLGLGLTSAPATESIMGVVRPEQAGAGSAVNDATREVGGTLGVAVVGSIGASLYAGKISGASALSALPPESLEQARRSLGDGLGVAAQAPGELGQALREAVTAGFLDGLQAGCLTVAGVCAAGAVAVLAFLPSRPSAPAPATTPEPELVSS